MTYGSSVDTRVLLIRLIAYHKSLERHLKQIKFDYDQLANRWQMFNSVAEGNYADQFRSGWLKTDAQFQVYNARSDQVKSLLNERIEFLASLNSENLEIYNQYAISSPVDSSVFPVSSQSTYISSSATTLTDSPSSKFQYVDRYNYFNDAGDYRPIRIEAIDPDTNQEIGFINAEHMADNRIKIKDTVVPENFRDQGVGSQLLENLIAKIPSGIEIYFQENQAPDYWIKKGFKERLNFDGIAEFFKVIE